MISREIAINTAKSFIKDCKSNGLEFHKVLLFGSFAKNEAHNWSDIDLLLISDQFGDNVFDNLKLYSKVNIKYPIIETHPYPTYIYLEGDDYIKEISKDVLKLNKLFNPINNSIIQQFINSLLLFRQKRIPVIFGWIKVFLDGSG